MNILKHLFKKPLHTNPAIDRLYRSIKKIDPDVEGMITALPKLAEVYQEGGKYLLHKTLLSQFKEYDTQYDTAIFAAVDDEKGHRMLRKLTCLMLVTFFKELSIHFSDGPYPSALTDALHFEIYQEMPAKAGSFVEYLNYQNPNFDDRKMAFAFKFGNDIAEIVSAVDLSFSFLVAQQAVVITDISKKLMRWILWDEEMAPS